MFDRIFLPARSFRRVCRYVCHDEQRAEVIYQEGVRGHDHRLMAYDFNAISQLRTRTQKPVFHGVLSFHADERMDDAKMIEIAGKFLDKIRLKDMQYVVTKHIDKAHLHVHIIANRIDYKGKYIDQSWDHLQAMKATRELVQEYKLMLHPRKIVQQTNLQALDARDAKRYKIYQAIKDSLPSCRNFAELQNRLLKLGVETRYRYNERTGRREGVSFRYERQAFKGGKVDPAFTLHKLEQALVQRHQLSIWEKEKIAFREKQQALSDQLKKDIPPVQEKLTPLQTPAQKQQHKHKLRIS